MESINRLADRALSLRVAVLVVATIASAVLQSIVQQGPLNRLYAASGYPVPYYVGQTSFSADKLEGWYRTMDAAGTLGVYWQTQFVDFTFIIATALLHFWLLVLVARMLPAGTWRRVAIAFVTVGFAAPAFDALENLVSFVALANPAEINPVVAIVYSSIAVLKFAGFFAVYLWVAVGVVTAVILRVRARSNPAALIGATR